MADVYSEQLLQDLQQGSQKGEALHPLVTQLLAQKGKRIDEHEDRRLRELAADAGTGITGLTYVSGAKRPEVETL